MLFKILYAALLIGCPTNNEDGKSVDKNVRKTTPAYHITFTEYPMLSITPNYEGPRCDDLSCLIGLPKSEKCCRANKGWLL